MNFNKKDILAKTNNKKTKMEINKILLSKSRVMKIKVCHLNQLKLLEKYNINKIF